MNETIDITLPTTDTFFKKYIPILTAICCLTSIVLFVGINLEGKPDNWEVYKKWGSPSVTDIFNGSYWGLFTSNFLHTELWHIAFNLYWLWIFGKKIEFESSKAFYGLLILSSALVSSLSELSFADTTGIGLSGIGYSLFGFIFIKSKTTEAYKNYLDKRTIRLFILWLFLCIVLTQTKAWNVGNAAHIGGLLWGMTLAYISKFDNYKQWTVGFLLFSVLASSIFWNPFSTSWLSHQAFELHKNQKADEAIIVYKKILSRDPQNEFAKTNLKQLEIHKLQEKAVELHSSQKYKEARQVYNQILSIDPDEQWAKDNLKILPNE
jgi:membrane associated rhomboid family serine protease